MCVIHLTVLSLVRCASPFNTRTPCHRGRAVCYIRKFRLFTAAFCRPVQHARAVVSSYQQEDPPPISPVGAWNGCLPFCLPNRTGRHALSSGSLISSLSSHFVSLGNVCGPSSYVGKFTSENMGELADVMLEPQRAGGGWGGGSNRLVV